MTDMDNREKFSRYLEGWYTDHAYGRYMAALTRVLVQRFRPRTVLDVGCARGFLVDAFRNQGCEAFGIDVADAVLRNAPETLRSFLFTVDITQEPFPFENDTFDLVACLETLEHLPSADLATAEMFRVLKPGGTCFITTPTTLTERRPWGGSPLFSLDPTHCNVQSRSFWLGSFKADGFEYVGELPGRERRAVVRWLDPGPGLGEALARIGLWPIVPQIRYLPMFRCMSVFKKPAATVTPNAMGTGR